MNINEVDVRCDCVNINGIDVQRDLQPIGEWSLCSMVLVSGSLIDSVRHLCCHSERKKNCALDSLHKYR